MKTKLLTVALLLLAVFIFTCRKTNVNKTQPTPIDSLVKVTPHTKAGVESLLIGAYALLDGVDKGQSGAPWETGTDNWAFGSIGGGEANKGSTVDDQSASQVFDKYTTAPDNVFVSHKWDMNILALQLTNSVFKVMALVTDGSLTTEEKAATTAEARFLRGFYELELAKIWRNVPYIDESVAYADYGKAGNNEQVWDKIAADFTAAMNGLPTTQSAVGKPNKYAAEAFLVKTLLFNHKYADAKPFLTDLITNGQTSIGTKYNLVHYADNFNPLSKPNAETVFLIRAVVHNGSDGEDGNAGDMLNFPTGGPGGCCGYFQPTFSFVNAFKTDAATGLPLLDTFNDEDLKNDQMVESAAPFTPSPATIDSRLDWTVGRRGIPYLDWGIMPGRAWVHNQDAQGPYVNIKSVYYQAAQAATSETYGGWANNQATSNGYNAIRYADVLLWAAEAEVEAGSLQKAEDYVNMVRSRAAYAAGWVHTYTDPANPTGGYTTTPAANYKVGLYGAAGGHAGTGFAAGGQGYARKAVYFERLLELGMEGHRFFDLQRWDGQTGGPAGAGYMAGYLNAHLTHEGHEPKVDPNQFSAVSFTSNKNELYPIPKTAIDKSGGKLKQNPGY